MKSTPQSLSQAYSSLRLHEVEPFEAVCSVVGVLHLYRDDFSWLYTDARFLLHCRIDGEDSLGADAATARSSVLFQDDYAESLLRGLDGGREAEVPAPQMQMSHV